jgi:hypothetical protein
MVLVFPESVWITWRLEKLFGPLYSVVLPIFRASLDHRRASMESNQATRSLPSGIARLDVLEYDKFHRASRNYRLP